MERLLARFGYVKLNRYGLVLTPEGRILSMRHATLDDGFGGRIVGWMDTDLVATQLNQWEAKKPVPAPVRPPAPVVAAAEEPEDDWEWTIAIARARAEAETPIVRSSVPSLASAPARTVPQVITGSVPSLAQVKAAPPPIPARRPNATVPPPVAAVAPPMAAVAPPMAAVAPPKKAPSQPKIAPAQPKIAPAQPKIAPVIPLSTARRAPTAPPKLARAASPQTVIPVPKLPRIAKGTNQVIPTPQVEAMDQDTQVGLDIRDVGESTRVDLPRVAR